MNVFLSISRGLRDALSDQKVRSLLAFTGAIILVATVVFRFLEGWSFLDAAFFSVVTISTVGYGELVPQTVAGKIFCMFYILVGLGVFVTAASAVAEAVIQRNSEIQKED